MRKITKDAISAFMNHLPFYRDNTSCDGTRLSLFGNVIAEWRPGSELWITTAGYPTMTTKERLKALPGVNVWTSNHQLYLQIGDYNYGSCRNKAQPWDGSWVRVI